MAVSDLLVASKLIFAPNNEAVAKWPFSLNVGLGRQQRESASVVHGS